jgi:hypothetical protein
MAAIARLDVNAFFHTNGSQHIGVVLNVGPDGITSKHGCPMAKTSWLSKLLRASALLAVALLFAAGSTKADKITMFDAASNYPIGVAGLALCPTPAACNQSSSHAIASFYFSPLRLLQK